MALTQELTFEEGTNGANLVASGPYLAVSGPPTYDDLGPPHGLVMLCTNGDYATVATASVDNGAFSVHFEITAVTTGVPRIITFTDSANTFIGMFRAHTDGKFDIANGSSTRVSASATSWAAGQYRVDGYLGGSGTSRTVTLKVFSGDTNTSPVWDTGGAVAITSSTAGAWARSRPGAQGNTNGTLRILRVRHYDTQIFAGPLASTVSGVLAAALPAPAATLQGLRQGHGSGAAALPGPAATLVGLRQVAGAAAASLPGAVATLAGLRQGFGSGLAALPAPTATLQGLRRVAGAAVAALPAPTATLQGLRQGFGSGAVVLPAPTATLLGTVQSGAGTVNGTLAVTLPAPAATLSGLRQGFGSGAALLPAPTAQLVGLRRVSGSGAALLPAPVAALAGLRQGFGAGLALLPAPVAYLAGAGSTPGLYTAAEDWATSMAPDAIVSQRVQRYTVVTRQGRYTAITREV